MADEQKIVRVGVVQGFQHAVSPEGERTIHLPGAVIDLTEDEARVEMARNRVVEVDPSTPLREGYQPVTEGQKAVSFTEPQAADSSSGAAQ
jgi:hypothetical protein